MSGCAVLRYFFRVSTGTVGCLEKVYWYCSTGYFSQFLGDTRYFCNIFYDKKMKKMKFAQTHLPQQFCFKSWKVLEFCFKSLTVLGSFTRALPGQNSETTYPVTCKRQKKGLPFKFEGSYYRHHLNASYDCAEWQLPLAVHMVMQCL